MVRLGVCLALLALCGCTPLNTHLIKKDSLAFNETIEDATNKLLVLNVLRARDKAPLHFADIPVIRQSMSQGASLSALDFVGSLTTSRDTRSAGLSASVTPSFEVTTLQSKEFHTGLATAIDAKIVKHWLDRGLDRRIVLLLFFSAAEIIETRGEQEARVAIRIMNSPRDAVEAIRARTQSAPNDLVRCDAQSDFERYLKLINSLRSFFAHSYRERRLLAGGLNLEPEKDSRAIQPFVALDQTKTQLIYDKGTRTYSLYTLSPDPKVAFCVADAAAGFGMRIMAAGETGIPTRQNCFRPMVDVPPEDSTHPSIFETPIAFPGPASVTEPRKYCAIFNQFVGVGPQHAGAPRLELRLHLRSVGEIFQFLGDLLYYQDEVKRHLDAHPQRIKLNTPITFGYCGDNASAGCDDVFMRLDADWRDARFSLDYRGTTYRVGNFGKDHTLEVLAVLHQLVGLHRSAADLRQTPTVQVLP